MFYLFVQGRAALRVYESRDVTLSLSPTVAVHKASQSVTPDTAIRLTSASCSNLSAGVVASAPTDAYKHGCGL